MVLQPVTVKVTQYLRSGWINNRNVPGYLHACPQYFGKYILVIFEAASNCAMFIMQLSLQTAGTSTKTKCQKMLTL